MVITTLGKDGIFINQLKNNKNYYNFIRTNAIDYIDVCGAGDTIISILSLGIINNLDLVEICKLANLYCSLTITRIGTNKIYFYEIFNIIKNIFFIELNDLILLTNYLKKYKNLKIGITSGCFDIFSFRSS